MLNKSDFQGMRSGSRFFASGVLVLYVKETKIGRNRMGIAVSKKFGKANKRNTFKRLLKESFRLNQNAIKNSNFDIVVTPNLRKINKEGLEYNQVFKMVQDDLKTSMSCSFKR